MLRACERARRPSSPSRRTNQPIICRSDAASQTQGKHLKEEKKKNQLIQIPAEAQIGVWLTATWCDVESPTKSKVSGWQRLESQSLVVYCVLVYLMVEVYFTFLLGEIYKFWNSALIREMCQCEAFLAFYAQWKKKKSKIQRVPKNYKRLNNTTGSKGQSKKQQQQQWQQSSLCCNTKNSSK